MGVNTVEIVLDGKTRSLKYDFNSLADMEEKAGIALTALLSEGVAGFRSIRLLLWAGLKWENRGLTLERIGNMLQKDLIEANGNLEYFITVIGKALEKSGIIRQEDNEEQGKNLEERTVN